MEGSDKEPQGKNECPTSGPPNHPEQPSYYNYDAMDNPHAPLLYAPTLRRSASSRFSTALLSAVLVLIVLNCLLTARELLSTYQVELAVRYS
jgi:hypothetical protein